jgi:hypothetical protein
MDCFQFAGLVHDLGRRGRLDGIIRDQALAHAESCARCARRLEEVESLEAALRSVVADQAGERADGRVEAVLVAQFLATKKGTARRSVLWEAAAVAAAVLVLVTGGWALRRLAPALQDGTSATGKIGAANGSSAATAGGSQEADTVVAENGSGTFIRLPYAGDGRVVEDDAIVRAVLPRSALASLGFPVGDVNASEPVPVELMVGEDGTPEAIRLVSQDIEQ